MKLLKDIIYGVRIEEVKGNTNIAVENISFDSREVNNLSLFIAIKGKNFDGHEFLEKAIQKGASGVVVSCKDSAIRFNGLLVKNTHAALLSFAKFSRNRFKGKIIAITGSNGKTTTKDMAKIIFNEFGKTFATPGNNNNLIGLSLSLMKLPYNCHYCILELGMSKKNELKKLSLIANWKKMLWKAHLSLFDQILLTSCS